jgi:hypothetical protein
VLFVRRHRPGGLTGGCVCACIIQRGTGVGESIGLFRAVFGLAWCFCWLRLDHWEPGNGRVLGSGQI